MMIPAPPRHTRRGVVTGLAALAALQPFRPILAEQAPVITLRPGADGPAFDSEIFMGLRDGDRLRFGVANALAAPAALGLIGLDGLQALQPLLNQPLEPGKVLSIDALLAQAGTFALQARLLGDGLIQPRGMALHVAERSPPQVDSDFIFLIEDARLRSDGTAVAPGTDAGGTQPTYTVNGRPSFAFQLRTNQRVRLRLINGCQRNAIALQFDDHDVRVIAIDSRPAEPFLARDRRLVLAPGARMDVLVDATQPAGSTSAVQLFDGSGPKRIGQLVYADTAPARAQILPAADPLPDVPIKLELASALRAQIDLGGSDWPLANDLVAKRPPPLFRVGRGRTVLLTLSNRTTLPTTFHLYGHHFRWLDRLDDGWKPFLPDTMLVDVGQTERIAFRADYAGDWLIENTPMNWSAPQRVHWFTVE